MKTAKRVLAILMAVMMAVSTFAVAASAAGPTLQSKIDGATAGQEVSIAANTKESVTVTKNLTIDLGGKILKSVNGSPAIVVSNGAQVTIKNGYVEGYYKTYNGVSPSMIRDVIQHAPSAIEVKGANTKVILEDVRALGGLVRIPSTREYFVPLGSAVKIYGGAAIELNSAVLIGSYGISNDPAGTGHPDGTIWINDAILIGFLDFIKRVDKRNLTDLYDEETVEMVNAADRVAGFLNSNITLTSGEKELLRQAFDDRIYIFTKKPVDTAAVVTIDKNDPDQNALIQASTVEYLTREDGGQKSTDCSYKYVPYRAYDAQTDATIANLTANAEDANLFEATVKSAAVEGKEVRIAYRLEFELKGDVKKLANDFDTYFRRYYNLAIEKINASYQEILTKYNEYVEMFADAYNKVQSAGNIGIEIDNQEWSVRDEMGDSFYAILRSLLSVGGATLYKKAEHVTMTSEIFTKSDLYGHGTKSPDEGTYELRNFRTVTRLDPETHQPVTTTIADVYTLGVLDKVQHLLDEFEEIRDGASLGDQTKWNDYAKLILDNYHDVLDWVGEAEAAVAALNDTLTSGQMGKIVDAVPEIKDKLSIISTLVDGTHEAAAAVRKYKDMDAVKDVMNKLDSNNNEATINQYMAKVKRAVNDYRAYFEPEKYVSDDGAFGLTYTLTGPTTPNVIEKTGTLYVKAYGGTVSFDAAGTAPVSSGESYTAVPFGRAITLTATPIGTNEFMYYMDEASGRILSTNPTMRLETQAERYIYAVFEDAEKECIVLTNTSGVYAGDADFTADGAPVGEVDVPTFKGYDAVGWGPKGADVLKPVDCTSAYLKGNSAFEDGANYNVNGFAFKLNKNTTTKYLATPRYTASASFTITFIDGNDTWSKEVEIGKTTSYTAKGDNFSYWVNGKGQIISVYRTYNVLATEESEFTAVYNQDVNENGYVTIFTQIQEDKGTRIYAETSVPAGRKVLSGGFIISFDATKKVPKIEDVNESTVKATYPNTGYNEYVYTVRLLNTTIANNPNGIFVRAYTEVKTATGSEFIYSDVYSTVD